MKMLIYPLIIVIALAKTMIAGSEPCQRNFWEQIDNYQAPSISEIDTKLLQAARNGDRMVVLGCLQDGAKLEAADDSGFTPLHCAVENNQAELVSVLLKIGSNPHAINRYGWTPLQESCWRNGNPSIVTALINAGADVNHRSYDQSSPLIEASQAGHLEAARLLLAAGADPNAEECYEKRTPYLRAFINDDAQMLELLLLYQATIKSPEELKLRSEGSFYGMDSIGLQWTPLHRVAYLQHHGFLVRLIQEQGVNVNARDLEGNTPLHILLSVMSGLNPWTKNCLQILKKARADLCIQNNKGQTPLDLLEENRSLNWVPETKKEIRRLLE
jgi:ankyrin repeat protein